MAALKQAVELVAEAAVAALGHAARGERGAAVTLLVAMDVGYDHPHPNLRRYVRANIRRVEAALGLPHVEDVVVKAASHAL